MEKEFIKIITDHQGLLLKVCRMYGNQHSDSEGLFQEIVLQLWKSYPRFNRESKITTWMYRVALNTAISSLRRIKRIPDSQQLSLDHHNLQENKEERIDIQYDQALQQAILALNKFDKALVLLYLDENSYLEMSEIMGISESNIGVKINRIKKKLKQILNPYNMELDDLKANWQKETENYSQLNKKNMQQMQFILHQKTADLITSMKKKFEKIISIMLGGMLIFVLVFPFISDGFLYPGSINGFAKMMFFYLVLIIFYWEKLKNINNLDLSDHIKERLEQLLKMLRRDRRIEMIFLALFFIGFILVGRFFYGKGLSNLDDRGVMIGFPLALVFTGIMIYVIIKRYQKEMSELKKYLDEYQNEA